MRSSTGKFAICRCDAGLVHRRRGLLLEDDGRVAKAAEAAGDAHAAVGHVERRGHGGDVEGAVDVVRLADFVPMDPRLNLMMRAMVASVAGVTEKLERAQQRAQDQGASRANRVILTMRRAILEPVLFAWAELVRNRLRLGRKALRAALHAELGRGWRQWLDWWSAASASRQSGGPGLG